MNTLDSVSALTFSGTLKLSESVVFPLPNDAKDPLSMFSMLPSKDAPSSNSLH